MSKAKPLTKMDVEQYAAQYDIDEEDIPGLLSSIAIHAYEKYKQSGSRYDIDAAVGLTRQGISRTDGTHPSFTTLLNNLGVFLESV